MSHVNKLLRAEETKTISIGELLKLRFRVLKPGKGIIEVVNEVDYGRVCSLRISDFRSKADAEVYAGLLRLAPELLKEYLRDTRTLEQVVARLERRMSELRPPKKGKHGRKKM